MPIIISGVGTGTTEAFTLDGLALNDGVTFGVDSVSWPPPRERQDWVGAADSEAQLLFRKPLHENRKVTLRVAVIPQTTMDLALAKVAQLVDKLAKASQYQDGIGLVWAPATSTLSCTFDVLSGEITDLPIDWENGWLALAPTLTIELTCKPYWRGTEVLTGLSSSSTPILSFEITNVTGDIPALGRLIITDTATQSRRHVEWGLEGPLTYNASTSLLVDSDDMVTTGFSGVQAVTTGAYDPNATGNNSITLTPIAGATTALAGTGNLSHVGVFRVKARIQSGAATGAPINLFRFSWKAGDGPTNHNDWVTVLSAGGWQELDLGTITVPAVTLGTQRWTGQVEVQGAATSPGTVALDYLILVPAADGYGKARAAWSYSSGVLVAYDTFAGTTAGNTLDTRTAPLGGSWVTSGDATDFVFSDNMVGSDGVESLSRSVALSETTGRFGILGATSYTNSEINARARFTLLNAEMALILRWVDASNFLRLKVNAGISAAVVLEQVVAGVTTTLATPSPGLVTSFTSLTFRFRLIAYASGAAVAQVFSDDGLTLYSSAQVLSSALATGGALATGKPGIGSRNTSALSAAHHWDDIAVYAPAAEPITLYSGRNIQVRYDDTLRQDSAGTYYGRTPSYRGSRFLLPVGTSRVLVKARRNDIETALDDVVTDSLQAQVGWTPRGLVVPRA